MTASATTFIRYEHSSASLQTLKFKHTVSTLFMVHRSSIQLPFNTFSISINVIYLHSFLSLFLSSCLIIFLYFFFFFFNAPDMIYIFRPFAPCCLFFFFHFLPLLLVHLSFSALSSSMYLSSFLSFESGATV